MDLYDFKDKSIVASLRLVCNRLVLRAETQQVDRILVAFAKRWCDCNPNHGFKHMDIIHTICYSIMLLNTDLHVADIESKMTRSQFIKNTMTTIKQALEDAAPESFDRASILPGKGQNLETNSARRSSLDQDRPTNFRYSFLPPRPESALGNAPSTSDKCGPLVKAPLTARCARGKHKWRPFSRRFMLPSVMSDYLCLEPSQTSLLLLVVCQSWACSSAVPAF